MQFEGGPLSKLLSHPDVVAAAKWYVTIRVRVPEAYLLLEHYATERPGLLVLDADGRRIDSIPLPGMGAPAIEPKELAKRLLAAKDAPPREIWRFTANGSGETLDKLRAALAARDGVAASRDGEAFRAEVKPGALSPAALLGAAKAHDVTVAIHEPVPVNLSADGDQDQAATGLAALPGVWHVARAPALRAWVTRLFLRPDTIARAGSGCVPDVESKVFLLPGIPKGGAGCRVAMAPLHLPGVLTIHADIFNDRQTVVGRRGEVSWDDVAASFAKAGCKATPQ